jgi:hypothetical protein
MSNLPPPDDAPPGTGANNRRAPDNCRAAETAFTNSIDRMFMPSLWQAY